MASTEHSRASESDPIGELDEVGFTVIDVLADRQTDVLARNTVPFSELAAATGVDDERHLREQLDEMDGRFLFEREDGYRLGYAGKKLHEALLGVDGGADPGPMSSETDHDCPICGAAVTATYRDEELRYECPDHEVVTVPVPPAAAAKSDVERLDRLVDVRPRRRLEMAREGCCWNCWGEVHAEYPVEPPEPDAFTGDVPSLVHFGCEDCGTEFGVLLSQCLSVDPAVVSFCYDAGVDLSTVPFVAVESVLSVDAVETADEGVRATVRADDETETFRLDEAARVSEVAP